APECGLSPCQIGLSRCDIGLSPARHHRRPAVACQAPTASNPVQAGVYSGGGAAMLGHSPYPHSRKGCPMSPGADRNLLVGLLALQMDLLTREQLLDGFQAWMLQKETTVGEILLQQGVLRRGERDAVEALVRCRLERHGDVQASLAALRVAAAVRQELSRL